MKKIKQKHKDFIDQDNSPMSTLAEALKQAHPEMLKQVENWKKSNPEIDNLVDDLIDLFPFSWDDPSLLEEAVSCGYRGEFEEAIGQCEELLKRQSQAYPAFHLMGYYQGSLGFHKEAIENYKKSIKVKPDYPQVYIDLGIEYSLAGKEKKCFSAFKQAVALLPDFELADQWMEFAFEKLGRFNPLTGLNGKGFESMEGIWANACCYLGKAFIEFRQHIPARHAFKKAVKLMPDFSEAVYELGALHLQRLRSPKKAKKYLDQAEAMFLKDNDWQNASLAHQLKSSYEEVPDKDKAAEEWLKEALRLQKAGRFRVAIDAYKNAIRFRPKNLEAYYNMGIAYGCIPEAGTEEIDKAIWAFKDTLKIKPDYIHAYIGLAASYIKMNRFQDTIELLIEAIDIAPNHSPVFYYLGMAYRMSGQLDKAIGALKQSVELQKDSVQALFDLGLALLDKERFQESCDAFQEAVRLKPDFAAGHYMLGNVYYLKLVDIEKALVHLKKAERLYLKLEDYYHASRIRQLIKLHPE